MTAPQIVSLLSCFVCDERSSEQPTAADELAAPLKQMQDFARRIAKVSIECKLELDEEQYVEKVYFHQIIQQNGTKYQSLHFFSSSQH